MGGSHRSAVLCSAVRCSAVQCGAVRCGAVQCGTVRCGVVDSTAVFCSAVHSIRVRSIRLDCSAIQRITEGHITTSCRKFATLQHFTSHHFAPKLCTHTWHPDLLHTCTSHLYFMTRCPTRASHSASPPSSSPDAMSSASSAPSRASALTAEVDRRRCGVRMCAV